MPDRLGAAAPGGCRRANRVAGLGGWAIPAPMAPAPITATSVF
jgi:hypothetical protein